MIRDWHFKGTPSHLKFTLCGDKERSTFSQQRSICTLIPTDKKPEMLNELEGHHDMLVWLQSEMLRWSFKSFKFRFIFRA